MEREEEGGKDAGWGFESPSLLNREVSSILSRASLPGPEDERHKAAVSLHQGFGVGAGRLVRWGDWWL